MQLPCTVWFLPRVQKPPRISIGNSMICNDIWYKYHEWYFKLPCYPKFGITNVALWVIFWWFVVGFWIERWSRWSPEFFFQASLRNCINCVHCDDHFYIFRSRYVNKPWSCKNGGKKLTCVTFLCMIALRNKTRGGLPYERDGDARRKFWI